MHQVISRPIKDLISGTQAVSDGNINFRFNADRPDDFGVLAGFFNRMMDHLEDQQQQLKEKADEISHQAYHDTLTGLPNRRLFLDRLYQAMASVARTKRYLFVMFLDLDRFKIINDSLGHSAGDELLQIISERLADCVRDSDTVSRFPPQRTEPEDHRIVDPTDDHHTVARLGGDEFIFLATKVKAIVKETGLDPSLLDLEITETILMNDSANTAQTLQEFNEMAIRLSLDDFGTGYSSLGYLRRFTLDTLKIDRSFITDTPHANDLTNIVQAIIMMAHSLNMTVVAEGVENQNQAQFLLKNGCDTVQGFLFSKPLPGEEFKKLLQSDPTYRF